MTARRKELAFVGPCEWRRLPVMRVRWLEECEVRTRAPKILERGYRAGMKPGNHGRRFPPEPLTPDEVLRLIASVPNGKVGVRNRALIALLWRTGLRIECEALRLLPHHVDFGAKRSRDRGTLRSGEGLLAVSDDSRASTFDRGAFAFRCRSGCQRRSMATRNCANCGAEFIGRERPGYVQMYCGRGCSRSAGATGTVATPWRERFWRYVTATDGDACWEWQGARNEHGYGRLNGGPEHPRTLKAHRASYIIHKGEIPAGMQACHQCDNPPCVNPAHLFLGTMRDNLRDAAAKGRTGPQRGGSAKTRRLTDEHIRQVRVAANAGFPHKDIGARFGITASYVSDLSRGKARPEAGGPFSDYRQIRPTNAYPVLI